MNDCILHIDCDDFSQVEFSLFSFESEERPLYNKVKIIINETKKEYDYKVVQLENKYYIVTD